MPTNKTMQTDNSVQEYVNAISDESKRKDFAEMLKVISDTTRLTPKMWGTGIVGFGTYHYKYDSGHEGDAPLVGIAARTTAITLYATLEPKNKEALLLKLGKHKTGKGCIYIKKMEDIDQKVLKEISLGSIAYLKSMYP